MKKNKKPKTNPQTKNLTAVCIWGFKTVLSTVALLPEAKKMN